MSQTYSNWGTSSRVACVAGMTELGLIFYYCFFLKISLDSVESAESISV